jgi:hypothetical protein
VHELIAKVCADNGWSHETHRIVVQLEGGRSHDVMLQEYEAKGHTFLRLYSFLGDPSSIDERQLRAALRLNWTLPYGAVGIASFDDQGEKLLLCDSVLVANIEPDRLKLAIQYMAQTADDYEKHVFGDDVH